MKLKKLNIIPDAYMICNARAIDGDTVRCNVQVGLGVTVERRLRLKGFFAPEMTGRTPLLAIAAAERLQAFLDANKLAIRTWGMKCDKYDRLVCELMWPDRPVTASEVLGELNMREEDHRRDLSHAKANPRRVRYSTEPAGNAGWTVDEDSGVCA